MNIYGISLDPEGTVMAQLSGACLSGIGLICWYAGNAGKSELRDGILLALFICDSIVVAVMLMGHLAGIGNLLVWPTAGLWLAMALGLCYFMFQSVSIEIIFLG